MYKQSVSEFLDDIFDRYYSQSSHAQLSTVPAHIQQQSSFCCKIKQHKTAVDYNWQHTTKNESRVAPACGLQRPTYEHNTTIQMKVTFLQSHVVLIWQKIAVGASVLDRDLQQSGRVMWNGKQLSHNIRIWPTLHSTCCVMLPQTSFIQSLATDGPSLQSLSTTSTISQILMNGIETEITSLTSSKQTGW